MAPQRDMATQVLNTAQQRAQSPPRTTQSLRQRPASASPSMLPTSLPASPQEAPTGHEVRSESGVRCATLI